MKRKVTAPARRVAMLVALAALGSVADAKDAHEAGSASAAPAEAPALMLANRSGGAAAPAVRIAPDLLVASLSGEKGDAVTLAAPAAESNTGKTTKHPAKPAPLTGSIVASDKGVAVIRADRAALDAARLKTLVLAKSGLGFADALTMKTADGRDLRAALQSARRFAVLQRDRVTISGAKPAAGGILLDTCGNLAGLVDAESRETQALPAHLIAHTVEDAGGKPGYADQACTAGGKDGIDQLIAQSRSAADAARARAADAAAAAKKLGDAVTGGTAQADARKRLDQLKHDGELADDAVKSAEKAISTLETYRSNYQRDRLLAIVSILAAIAAAVAGVVVLLRGRRQIEDREKSIAVIRAKTSNVEAKLDGKGWSDVVLRGESGVLTVSGSKLDENGEGAVIGRSADSSDVPFGPADVSRRHLKLFVRNNRLWVEDLDSAQGTFVNGRPVDPRAPISLSDGDTVRIASHEFELRIR